MELKKIDIDTKDFKKLWLESNSTVTATIAPMPPPTITFFPKDNGEDPLMFLDSNGDIYVKGKLVENDEEVVDGMRMLVTHYGIHGLKYENEKLKREVEELREYKFKYEQLCK
jgi:hypothetical protein